ncbi:MAG: hypothetical protein Fur0018_07060 [Anaerolineales bacterium]
MILETFPEKYAVYRYAPHHMPPPEIWRQPFVAAVRTPDEFSLVCPADISVEGAQQVEHGWSLLKVAGPLDFSLVGVLADLSAALAAASVSLFAISTFDTDYLLVKTDSLPAAVTALREAGHSVDGQGPLPPHRLTSMRRRDRQVDDDAWITALLDRAEYGVLSLCLGAQPFAVARNFVYDRERHCIYLHGARKGRTFETVQRGARAVLTVSEMGRLLPAERAMNMSVEFRGVMVYGRVSVVEDPDEATHALHLLVEKYFPHLQRGRDYEPVSSDDLKVTATLRLDVEAWSGKEKKAPDDFPGALRFGE